METGTILGVGALVVSAAGALNSMRAGKREDRTSAIAELQVVVTALKGEIERLKVENKEAEDECRRKIAECTAEIKAHTTQVQEMRATIVSQANQLQQLDRREQSRRNER